MAFADLRVVSTTADFSVVAASVGGDAVEVETLARPTEDPHFVTPRPSFVRVLNRADVLIESGAELEVGWLPPLVRTARNRAILPGGDGRVFANRGVPMLDVPAGPVDRSAGDVHPQGNPHFMLDPKNAAILATNLAHVFAALDVSNAAAHRERGSNFVARLERKSAEWTERLKPFAGTPVIGYHKSFDYFARRFGLETVDTIEPKPGVDPSPSHVNALVPKMRDRGVKLILVETNRPRKTPDYLAEQTGAKVVVLHLAPGAGGTDADYFEWMDINVDAVARALGGP